MPATVCRACGTPLTIDEPIPRDAECPNCGHDVRACVNCRHYDPRLHNSCRETEADPVEDRHRRNFCEYFQLSREPWTRSTGEREGDARKKLDQLFGGGPSRTTPSQSARDRLEGLFKKKPPDEG
jgi:predicted RNA-binding Zn-ribbon protein involved in translation (DUF1610 family)